MAKDQLESKDSSLFPSSDEREDSGLQDILSVATKLKETPEDDLSDPEDASGVILFRAGDLDGGDERADDDALFGSFAGGLGGGFEPSATEPLTSPDLTPLGGSGAVSEARPPEASTPAEEPKRNLLPALAVVLGLGLAAVGLVFLTDKDEQNNEPQQQAQAEMSANVDEAAVGNLEPTAGDPAAASGGQVQPEPEPEPEPEVVGETDEALLQGEDAGGLLAADTDGGDPMAQKAGLLEGGSNPVAKTSKWDQGGSTKEPEADTAEEPEEDPTPVVQPKPEPEPDPDPIKPAPSGGGNDDEVDCLLNPDLPKCNTGGSSKPKNEEVLAPKLPEKLSTSQLKSGFTSVKSKAKACGSKFGAEAGTAVKVHVSIEGATGKVLSVEAKGEHAGTDLGKCVEDAVEGATFEQFKMTSQGADYSLIM